MVTVLACALLWVVLVLPDAVDGLSLGAFLRVPVEGLLVVALLLVLPARARRPVALLLGMALSLVVLLKTLDLGFSAVLDRRFHEFYDWSYVGLGYAVLRVWVGPTGARVALVAVVVAAAVTVSLLVPATLRVQKVVASHPRTTARVLGAAGVVWVLGALTGLQVAGTPVASAATARLVSDHAVSLVEDSRAGTSFARAIDDDPFADAGEDLLAGLEGKDVLLVFVESYGRAALTEPTIAPGVTAVLESGTEELGEAGFSARSAYLTSPTFGGSSWLPHATLQTGLWTDNQARYDQLLAADRLTLTSAFGQAGWDTSFVLPAVRTGWPEGQAFYGFDELVGGDDLGYRGPELGWGAIPDQYTLSEVRRTLLDQTDRRPVMAQVDLVSSHLPWPPPPPLVGWDEVGDGSVFGCMPGCGRDPAQLEGMAHVRERYGESVRYVLRTLTSFVASHPDPDLVVVLLGDHQPWTFVTGPGPGHDVPVTIISADPEVLDRVDGWAWSEGMRPADDAPVWRMDAFRDRFLTAFSGRGP
ncbi:sulfatase [Ornithinimicrobium avium]|uniref:Sulfatase n=1 Tax=Ornithinimicrobium avium TaxID=2283195 RepID=A0A345NK80_9MICO|nr:sulfatase [Ornithinimicrobium avium]